MSLCMCPANERWRYILMLSPIGWAHTQNDPYIKSVIHFIIPLPNYVMLFNALFSTLRTSQLHYSDHYSVYLVARSLDTYVYHFSGIWEMAGDINGHQVYVHMRTLTPEAGISGRDK